ncbi:MAG: HAD family hydrolase [Rhodospirillaceae bacterium]|nr:HAD family hydrolase [Rhodospirillaceae bacterium]
MVKLPAPKAILFDWDNTLVDTWPTIGKALNITLPKMGHDPWSEDEIHARVAGSLRDTFPRIFGDRWEEAREHYYKAFSDVHLEMLRVLPGAEDVLKRATDHGIYLGVVSNKTGKYLRAEAQHLGWTGYFAKLVGAQDAVRDKPMLEPVHMALENSAITLGRHVWFVGDNDIDMECGQAGGCTTVLVHAEQHAGKHQPHVCVNDCSDLLQILDTAFAA